MAKKMEVGKNKPQNDRDKPNPSLRKGTGTMDMGKKLVRAPKKKARAEY